MKSITKSELTSEQIMKLIKVNFGDSCKIGKITELKDGMFNSAYLIERVEQNDNIVLKVSIKPGTKTLTYEKDIMPTEVEVYKLIAEKTDIPVPKILAFDFSKKHIPSNYFFMTVLDGVALHTVQEQMSKQNLMEIKKQAAGYLAQLHQIKGNYFGYFTQEKDQQYNTWKEAFVSMMNTILNDGKLNNTELPYDRYEKVILEKSKFMEDIKVPALVDYDLWSGNVFVKQQGGKFIIEGLIDFERAFFGDPMADFAGSMMLLENIYEEEEVFCAYKEKMNIKNEITREDRIRYAFYRLYIFTIMAAETFRYDEKVGKEQMTFAMDNIMRYLKILEEV